MASKALKIPTSKIYISETSTSTVPNTSPTAASVSTDINGQAVYVRSLRNQRSWGPDQDFGPRESLGWEMEWSLQALGCDHALGSLTKENLALPNAELKERTTITSIRVWKDEGRRGGGMQGILGRHTLGVRTGRQTMG